MIFSQYMISLGIPAESARVLESAKYESPYFFFYFFSKKKFEMWWCVVVLLLASSALSYDNEARKPLYHKIREQRISVNRAIYHIVDLLSYQSHFQKGTLFRALMPPLPPPFSIYLRSVLKSSLHPQQCKASRAMNFV